MLQIARGRACWSRSASMLSRREGSTGSTSHVNKPEQAAWAEPSVLAMSFPLPDLIMSCWMLPGCSDRHITGNYIADSFKTRVRKVLHGMGAGSDKRSRSRKGGMPI